MSQADRFLDWCIIPHTKVFRHT